MNRSLVASCQGHSSRSPCSVRRPRAVPPADRVAGRSPPSFRGVVVNELAVDRPLQDEELLNPAGGVEFAACWLKEEGMVEMRWVLKQWRQCRAWHLLNQGEPPQYDRILGEQSRRPV